LELEQGKRYSQATGESKAFLRSFIKRIEVNGNQVRIDYKPPSSARYSSREVTEVLPTVPLGGPNKTFAKPETFFEVSIIPAPSLQRGRVYGHS